MTTLTETATTFPASRTVSDTAKSVARRLAGVGRVAMGLLFFVGGLNGLHEFLPRPTTPMPQGAVAFAGAMMATGYLFTLVAATQLVGGLLLLANRFVPLGLALLAPIVVNILLFHVYLAPEGLGLAVVVSAVEVALAWSYRAAFAPLLAARAGR